jgi:hypothetical protein
MRHPVALQQTSRATISPLLLPPNEVREFREKEGVGEDEEVAGREERGRRSGFGRG